MSIHRGSPPSIVPDCIDYIASDLWEADFPEWDLDLAAEMAIDENDYISVEATTKESTAAPQVGTGMEAMGESDYIFNEPTARESIATPQVGSGMMAMRENLGPENFGSVTDIRSIATSVHPFSAVLDPFSETGTSGSGEAFAMEFGLEKKEVAEGGAGALLSEAFGSECFKELVPPLSYRKEEQQHGIPKRLPSKGYKNLDLLLEEYKKSEHPMEPRSCKVRRSCRSVLSKTNITKDVKIFYINPLEHNECFGLHFEPKDSPSELQHHAVRYPLCNTELLLNRMLVKKCQK